MYSSELRYAYDEGNIDDICRLLYEEVDLDSSDDESPTALGIAIRLNYIDIASLLLERGANVNAEWGHWVMMDTPLTIAITHGNTEAIHLLIDAGANINVFDDCAVESPLLRCLRSNRKDYVSLLLERGADINIVDHNRQSCLTFMVEENNIEMIRFLIEKGADMDLKDHCGMTALAIACILSRDECVDVLLHSGAYLDMDIISNYTLTDAVRHVINKYPRSLYQERDRSRDYMSPLYSDIDIIHR